MRSQVLRSSLVATLLMVAAVHAQVPQTPGASSPFAGRWEIVVIPPPTPGASASPDKISFFIIELSPAGGGLTGKVIDMVGSPLMKANSIDASVKDDQVTVVIDSSMFKLVIKGKRVGDHLEGTAAPEGTAAGSKEEAGFQGLPTKKDKLKPLSTPPQTPEQKAYVAAMAKSGSQRADALRQFLKDFPDSSRKEDATLQIALALPLPADKTAALQKFLVDYPNATQKDAANLELAMAAQNGEPRRAALQKFVTDFPKSPRVEQAEYEVINTFTQLDSAERRAAEMAFVKAHPQSSRTEGIYMSQFMRGVSRKPVDEAALAASMDGYIGAAKDVPFSMGKYQYNFRAMNMNTVADRLMVNEVMLPRALEIIEKALALSGDKTEPETLAMFTATHGQVMFKMKNFDAAEKELKRANQIKGGDGDMETHLYLGKVYEAEGKEDAALSSYFAAANLSYSGDAAASLERLYKKKNGTVEGLVAKMDAAYLAKPKPFEAGHYTRPVPKSKAPERVVLAELFTGSECAPCVAADLAFDGLAERYDRETLAVLVYHLHIPGPDPMTNPDTEARGKYYAVNGTPTALIDGLSPQVGGGGPEQSKTLFSQFSTKIEARAAALPMATLEKFKMAAKGDVITLTGQAALLQSAAGKVASASLHLALVEDSVRFPGSNGVRFHSLVVRKLVGATAGTPLTPNGKKLEVKEVVNVKLIAASLESYLTNYEQTGGRASANFKFSDRVDTLDARKLRLVAFIQNDQTKEILQSVVVGPGK